MGSPEFRCHRLQWVSVAFHLRCICLGVVALFLLAINAQAQILPLHGVLEYSPTQTAWPTLLIKAANGSAAYVLTMEPSSDIKNNLVGIDVVMRRPGARSDTRNLLEPPYRWHGYQEYMFAGSEFKNGANGSIFGTTRGILVQNRKLHLKFTIIDVETKPTDVPTSPNDYAFNKLVLDIEVSNLK